MRDSKPGTTEVYLLVTCSMLDQAKVSLPDEVCVLFTSAVVR